MFIGSDGPSSKSDWIEVGFELFFIGFKSDYLLPNSNHIAWPQIGLDLHQIRNTLLSLCNVRKKGQESVCMESLLNSCQACLNNDEYSFAFSVGS